MFFRKLFKLSDIAIRRIARRLFSNNAAQLGWILPDGSFIPVEWGQHSIVIQKYFPQSKNPEETAEDMGWLHITMSFASIVGKETDVEIHCLRPALP